jgi:Flp pilus assembly protein TadG
MNNCIDGLPVDKGGLRAGNWTRAVETSGFVAYLRRLLRCKRGVAAVEFGLAAPVLLAALVPVADLGIAFSQQQQLRQAVQAGAQYAAIQSSWNANSSPAAIAGAVTAATPLSGVVVSPAPYQQCGCPSGGVNGASSGITTATCGSTCANGKTAGSYVVISAQLPYMPVLPYSLLGSSTTLYAQAMIRIQ